jgi:DNA-binding transcriptional LysR family regulator
MTALLFLEAVRRATRGRRFATLLVQWMLTGEWGVELHQVRYFVTLCRILNFTRAAEACNVTQPALTRAIQRLEDELGGPLFQRERSLTQLTELGRLMRPLLEQTLAAAEAAKENATRFKRSELATLRVGLPPGISARIITSPLREMMRRIPTLEIELKMAEPDRLAEMLLQGEADAALLDDSITPPDRLDVWLLFKEGYQLAFAPGHRFAQLASLNLATLDGETLLQRRGCRAAVRLHELCSESGRALRLRPASDSEEHVQCLAAIGLGLTLLPEHVRPLPPLRACPLAEASLHSALRRERAPLFAGA